MMPVASFSFFFGNDRGPNNLDLWRRICQRKTCADQNSIVMAEANRNFDCDYRNVSLSSTFKFVLPPKRLGRQCRSYEEFRQLLEKDRLEQMIQNPKMAHRNKYKHYTLIIITEPDKKRILLGRKNRGFGKGFYNSFGGKVESSDISTAHSAQREVLEETNLRVPLEALHGVGTLHFSFQEPDMPKMIVHLFQLMVSTTLEEENHQKQGETESSIVRPSQRNFHGHSVVPIDVTQICCHDDEIAPEWFSDWHDIPLDKMFADDSIWLTHLLTKPDTSKQLDGWFHFQAGGAEINTILHWYLDVNPPRQSA